VTSWASSSRSSAVGSRFAITTSAAATPGPLARHPGEQVRPAARHPPSWWCALPRGGDVLDPQRHVREFLSEGPVHTAVVDVPRTAERRYHGRFPVRPAPHRGSGTAGSVGRNP